MASEDEERPIEATTNTATQQPSESQPVNRLPRRTMLLYSSGNVGAGAFYALNNFVLPVFLVPLGVPTALTGVLANVRSLEGAVIQPIVGDSSDRAWTRFGRRKPFILVCVPLVVLFLVLTPLTPHWTFLGAPFGLSPQRTTVILAVLGVFLFTVTFNIQNDPYTALLADITPVRQRGAVNGVAQAIQLVGQVVFLLTGAALATGAHPDIAPLFYVTAAALVVFYVPTLLGIREPRKLRGPHASERHRWREYWAAIKADRQVQLYFATQFFLWFGIGAISPFVTLYAEDVLGFSLSEALILDFVLLMSTALFVWPLGVLADRVGYRGVFALGMIVMVSASLLGTVVRQPILLFVILAFAGVGNAAQTASSYPLLTRLVFPDRMGLYIGLTSAVTSVCQPVGAAILGYIFGQVGPQSMFPFVAVMFLLALVPLAFLHVDRSVYARSLVAGAQDQGEM